MQGSFWTRGLVRHAPQRGDCRAGRRAVGVVGDRRGRGAELYWNRSPSALTIFIHPGSMDELEKRLRQRGTETPESLQRRLEVARQEMARAASYQYQVVNNTVSQAVTRICEILTEHRQTGDCAQ